MSMEPTTASQVTSPLALGTLETLSDSAQLENHELPASVRSHTSGSISEKQNPDPTDIEASTQPAIPGPEAFYVRGYKLVFLFVGMLFSAFLVSLDQTILATAIPKIVSQFDALEKITWIASAYFVTQCGLILTYGKVLSAIPTKWVYLFAVTTFEVGSAICGAAPNINVLIFGRALAGAGGAGIFVSCLSILAVVTPLERRPLLFGFFGALFAFSSVVGPLLGGALSDSKASWRWCFYINLPFGAVTIAAITAFIKPEHSAPTPNDGRTTWQRFRCIDWVGSVLSIGMVVSILLPLQWGGVMKPWKDHSVIALFCVFGALFAAFLGWEWYMGDEAVLPLRLFRARAQMGACIESFFLALVSLCATYYLPLWFQSAEQHSATRSGIDILTLMITIVVGAAASGAVINKTGHPRPFLLYPPLLTSIACGVIFWNMTNNPSAKVLTGLQVLLGLGVGAAAQNTIFAVQAGFAHQPHLIPQATSLVSFVQMFGGVLGISISGTIFGNKLTGLLAIEAPNLSSEVMQAVRESVAAISTLQGDDRANVVRAYSKALGYVFILGIPSGILASLSSLLIPDFNLKDMKLAATENTDAVEKVDATEKADITAKTDVSAPTHTTAKAVT